MPGRDGTGPAGFGSLTGRGLGICTGVNAGSKDFRPGAAFGSGMGSGAGYGCRKGRFCGFVSSGLTEKEILTAHKDRLESRLDLIGKQLERLKETEK